MTKPTTETVPDVTLIDVPNRLREKIGGSLSANLAQKAEAAATQLAQEFIPVLDDILIALLAAKDTERFRQALELKSMGTVCSAPNVTRVAASLCRLLEKTGDTAALIEAHINTLRVLIHQKPPRDEIAETLMRELEQKVAAL